jgi:hypothetical protein
MDFCGRVDISLERGGGVGRDGGGGTGNNADFSTRTPRIF